ncbi:MAG: hypothetical protein VX481_06700 [Cyanobacteriota bacterium]|nr:hypothetical protein [Cyanobacteriota bacterium]
MQSSDKAMQIRAELCHVDTLRCIVRIEAWQGNQLLGSALGEAQTSEEAETRGLERLMRRIAPSQPEAVPAKAVPQKAVPAEAVSQEAVSQEAVSREASADSTEQLTTSPARAAAPEKPQKPSKPEPLAATGEVQQPPTAEPPSEAPTDPEDWSEELAAIDLEVQRIGWDRDRERIYLERAFGHASRHRLTRYSDLVGFLRQLRAMQPGESPETAAVPLRRSDLLSQGDEMIRTMGWSSAQARDCLQKELGATSRQQLSDQQLMQFNMILENLMTRTDE